MKLKNISFGQNHTSCPLGQYDCLSLGKSSQKTEFCKTIGEFVFSAIWMNTEDSLEHSGENDGSEDVSDAHFMV